MIQDRLAFLLGPPRSGSTLLMRMLASHSLIYSRPETHLLTPLAYLGYYDYVDRAPYDQLQAAQAVREYVSDLPRGEEDYLDALRAYCDVLYDRMRATQAKPYFLEKTPAYALIWPFLVRVFPRARYVVLTRHPCSVWDSYAESFFDGDYETAGEFNPILDRYVPAIAEFIRARAVAYVHVRYEEIVADPEPKLRVIYEHIGVPHEPDTVEYGRQPEVVRGGLGDPLEVRRHHRPRADFVDKWVWSVAADPVRERVLREMVDRLDEDDVAAWGYDKATLFAPLTQVDRAEARARIALQQRRRRWSGYRLQRWALLLARRRMRHQALRAIVARARFLCDVLLRGAGGTGWSEHARRRYGGRPRTDGGE